MRRIISHRPTTAVSSFCAAVDGCRATISGRGFLPTDHKPYVRTPHTKPPTDIFVGQSAWVATAPNQLKNEERVRKALGIFFRDYGGRAAQDDGSDDDDESDEEDEWKKMAKTKVSEEELNLFLTNLAVECETDHKKYECVLELFHRVIQKMNQDDGLGDATQNDRVDKLDEIAEVELDAFSKYSFTKLMIECETDHEKYILYEEIHKLIVKMIQDDKDDELGDATQNGKVDKLAEIAEEELDALVTNSFTTKLMIECEPKYEKRFREIIEKVRKKMIQDDEILEAFELVTNLMSKCEPQYEKLLCEVLEKIAHQVDKRKNENIHKIEKLAKLHRKAGDIYIFEERLDKFVTGIFLKNLRSVEKMKAYFMAYEVIEKVAKKVGNENVRKIAEKKLDALVTNSFVFKTLVVQINIPYFKYLRLKGEVAGVGLLARGIYGAMMII